MKQSSARCLAIAMALGICALGPAAFADSGPGGGSTSASPAPCATVSTEINPSFINHLPTPSDFFTVKTNLTNCSSETETVDLYYVWTELSGDMACSNIALYGFPVTLKPGETQGFNDTEFEFSCAGVYQVTNLALDHNTSAFLASSSATLTISPQ
jgi:hypothetical protein